MSLTKLKSVLEDASLNLSHIVDKISVPDEPATNNLIRDLMAFELADVDLQAVDKEKIKQRFVAKYLQERNIEISHKDWKNLVWCLTKYDEQSIALVENKQLSDDINHRINNIAKLSELKSYISRYFIQFKAEGAVTEYIGLKAMLIIKTGKFDKFHNLHKKHEIFNPTSCVETFSQHIVKAESSIKTAFIEQGFNLDDRVYDNFYSAIYGAICKKNASLKLNEQRLREIMDWSISLDQLRYLQYKYSLLDALIIPLQNASINADLKEEVMKFILKHYSDPRIQPANWIGASDASKQTFLIWLASKAMEQFFNIVDMVAKQEQWDYRRKFWEAYLDRNIEVWVVFGQDCARQSRIIYGNDLQFAQFDGGGASKDHACLIIKLEDLLITEWSHNGACRIWTNSNKALESNRKRPPRMYKRRYTPDELRAIKMGETGWFRHSSSENYTWQRNISSFIYSHTNIHINQSNYFVSR